MNKQLRRLPAEWEPQDGVLLAWPHADSDWQPILHDIEQVYIRLAQQILRFERLLIVAAEPEKVAKQLQAAGCDLTAIDLYQLPANDTWARDFGPLTILEGAQPQLLDFTFNGWGLKFPADQDNQLTRWLHQQGAFAETPLKTCGLVLEGGSIESDGRGTILTTADCLLSPNRNPQLAKQQLEMELQRRFGAEQILWLEHGYLAGDDTDSHIDTLARFAPDDCILYVRCEDPADEHYPALRKMAAQLRTLRTRNGTPFRLVPLPWPQACYADSSQRLPATYANFLIINGAVLVPTYADPADSSALETIGRAFPDREIIGIDCRPIIQQHGSLHCIAMQIPQGVLP